MKPGRRVALVVPSARSRVASIGKLMQPILVDDERRWSVEWDDGYRDHPATTWPETWLYEVIPQ